MVKTGTWSTLRKDLVLRVFLAGVVALHLPYLFERWIGRVGLETYADLYLSPFLLPLVLWALRSGVERIPDARERRFWHGLTIAYGIWWIITMIFALTPWRFWGPVAELVIDVLYVLFYLFLFLSLELHVRGAEVRDRLSRLQIAGPIVLASGLLVYFILIPSVLHRGLYDTWVPSLYLYVTLDLFLMLAFLRARHGAEARRWRTIYGLLAATSACWAILDTFECMTYAGILHWGPGDWTDLLWNAPFLLLVGAARLREHAFGDEDRGSAGSKTGRVEWRMHSSLVFAVLAVPALHLILEAFDLFGAESRPIRQMTVLWTLMILGGMALVEQNILQRREAARAAMEAHLRQAQKLEIVGRLAGGMAHDVRNLLTVIQWHARMARRALAESDDPRTAETDLGQIDQAVDGAERMLAKLVGFSRPRESRPVTLELDGALERQAEMLRGFLGKGIEIEILPRSGDASVALDPVDLEQVIMNLCLNARDAMPEGGRISLESIRAELPTALALDGPRGEQVRLRVRDTGRGMDESTRERLFEPFFTTKDEGSGLGLAVVAEIVQRSGGVIDVVSALGEGTTFDLYWPFAKPDEEKWKE